MSFGLWETVAGKHSLIIGQSKDITHRLLSLDLSNTKRSVEIGPSNFPVSLSPQTQGDVLYQLELLLNMETNEFLKSEMACGRLSVDSVKNTVDNWANKGRAQVLCFRYDLQTQRDLVAKNIETLHFVGVNAFNTAKLHSILAMWRVLAKEISVRTFCQPDSVIRKHFHDAEKIMELLGVPSDSMLALREMKGRVWCEIQKAEKKQMEKEPLHGISVPWSPTMEYR